METPNSDRLHGRSQDAPILQGNPPKAAAAPRSPAGKKERAADLTGGTWWPKLHVEICGGFQSHRATPSHHPFLGVSMK